MCVFFFVCFPVGAHESNKLLKNEPLLKAKQDSDGSQRASVAMVTP